MSPYWPPSFSIVYASFCLKVSIWGGVWGILEHMEVSLSDLESNPHFHSWILSCLELCCVSNSRHIYRLPCKLSLQTQDISLRVWSRPKNSKSELIATEWSTRCSETWLKINVFVAFCCCTKCVRRLLTQEEGSRLLYFILHFGAAYWQINKLLIKPHSVDHTMEPLGLLHVCSLVTVFLLAILKFCDILDKKIDATRMRVESTWSCSRLLVCCVAHRLKKA